MLSEDLKLQLTPLLDALPGSIDLQLTLDDSDGANAALGAFEYLMKTSAPAEKKEAKAA